MKQQINLKEIERKTYRDVSQDGLMELIMGIMMFMVVGIIITPTILKVLFYLPILLLGRIIEALRKRFTYPRIGHVKFKPENVKKVVGGIFLIMFGLLAIMVIIFALFGDVRDFDLWMKWFPAFVGTLLVGMFLDQADKSGNRRYYVFGLLSVISGFSYALLQFDPIITGMAMYFLTMGIILIISGVVIFLWFLRLNPLPEETSSHGA